MIWRVPRRARRVRGSSSRSATLRVDRGSSADDPRSTLTVADLELDPLTRRARRGTRQIILTAKEFAVLEYLMRRPPHQVLQYGEFLRREDDLARAPARAPRQGIQFEVRDREG